MESKTDLDTLVQIRAKLDTLVGSLWTLEGTLVDGGDEAMSTWADIISKYQNALTFTQSLSSSLVGPPPLPDFTAGTDLQQARERQEYQNAWQRTLARYSVQPNQIPEDPEALSGLLSLLVTRQNPEIEDEREVLKKEFVPKHLSAENNTTLFQDATSQDVKDLQGLVKDHDTRVTKALEHLEDFLNSGDDGDPFDWRMRLDLDMDNDDNDNDDDNDNESKGEDDNKMDDQQESVKSNTNDNKDTIQETGQGEGKSDLMEIDSTNQGNSSQNNNDKMQEDIILDEKPGEEKAGEEHDPDSDVVIVE